MFTKLVAGIFATAFLVCIASIASFAAQDPSPQINGKHANGDQNVYWLDQVGGSSHAVAVHGNKAYVGLGAAIAVFDISDQGEVSFLGKSELFSDVVRDLVVVGDYVYCVIGEARMTDWYKPPQSQIQIVDVSNPATPIGVNSYVVPGLLQHLDADQHTLYLVEKNRTIEGTVVVGGLRLLDIGNPPHLSELSFLVNPSFDDVAVSGRQAYVSGSNGLHILDVSDRTQPHLISAVTGAGSVKTAAVDGEFVYAITTSALMIVDISDPAVPLERGMYPCSCSAVATSDTYVYVVDNSVRALDVSNPLHPAEAGRYQSIRAALSLVAQGEMVYFSSWGSTIEVVDFTSPAHPRQIGGYQGLGKVVDIGFRYRYIYAIDLVGLHVLDPVNFHDTMQVGILEIEGQPHTLQVAGSKAYILTADISHGGRYQGAGLQIVDIDCPNRPFLLGYVPVSPQPLDFAVVDRGDRVFAYITRGHLGFSVYDITLPHAPIWILNFDTKAYHKVEVHSDTAYFLSHSTVEVFDISNPILPQKVGAVQASRRPTDIHVPPGYRNLVDAVGNGIQVFDTSDRQQPQLLGHIQTLDLDGRAMVDKGDVIYVADGNRGLRVFDPADLDLVPETGRYDTSGHTQALDVVHWVDGPLIVVADGEAGAALFRYRDPQRSHWHSEAEEGELTFPMVRVHTGTSCGQGYVYTAAEQSGIADYSFSVPATSSYFLWARVKGQDWGTNSFWVSIDDRPAFHYEIPPSQNSWDWRWHVVYPDQQPEDPVWLAAGEHTLRFEGREPYAYLDTLLLGNYSDVIPEDQISCLPADLAQPTPGPYPTPVPTPAPPASCNLMWIPLKLR